jgi:ketosteroid isomerase-like protein
MSNIEHQAKDVEEIVKVHHDWINSNVGLDIDKMLPNFADPGYVQFNLNGHTYESVHEKVKLWEGFHQIGFDLKGFTTVREPSVYVDHDLAYLTAVWSCQFIASKGKGSALMEPTAEPVTFRVTEVYRRDDGTGKPVWKIWHFHASPVAPPGSAKYPQEES